MTDTTYVTLTEAKAQLAIDEGLTIHDDRIIRLIGAAEDWAENYTQRSLAELMELDSPADQKAVAMPDPVDPRTSWPSYYPRPDYLDLDFADWLPEHYRHYWAHVSPGAYAGARDESKPLRRDVKAAILLQVQIGFDLNTGDLALLQSRAEMLLNPYRLGLGV